MAGVPCVNDTCSITSTVDANGRLNLSANLAANGGIVCGTDADPNAGLRANLFGDPTAVSSATLNECDNLLGVTTAGELFARRPKFELLNVDGTRVNFPSDGNQTGNSTNVTVTNNADCQRLLIVKTKFQFRFTTDNDEPVWKTDGSFVMETTPGSVYAYSFTAGGPGVVELDGSSPKHLIMGVDGTDVHVIGQSVSEFLIIQAGQNLTFTTYGDNRTGYNTVDGTGGTNGFTAYQQILMLDLAPGDLF